MSFISLRIELICMRLDVDDFLVPFLRSNWSARRRELLDAVRMRASIYSGSADAHDLGRRHSFAPAEINEAPYDNRGCCQRGHHRPLSND